MVAISGRQSDSLYTVCGLCVDCSASMQRAKRKNSVSLCCFHSVLLSDFLFYFIKKWLKECCISVFWIISCCYMIIWDFYQTLDVGYCSSSHILRICYQIFVIKIWLMHACFICLKNCVWPVSHSNSFPAALTLTSQSQRRVTVPDTPSLWRSHSSALIGCQSAVLSSATHWAQNSDKTVKLGSADQIWIKILFLHCLFLPQMFSETHFSFCLAVI